MSISGVVSQFAWDGVLLYAATTDGLLVSDDAGATWTVRQEGAFDAVAVDRGVVFAVAGETLFRDGTPVLTGTRLLSVAAGDGVVLAGTESDGVFRSTDGGATWKSANPGLLDLTVLTIATADRTSYLGTPSGLYRSRNGGRAWRSIELPVHDPAVQALAIAPDGTVFAGTEAHGLFALTDGEWRGQSLDGSSVTAIACSAEYTAVATEYGIFVSRGEGWHTIGSDAGPVLALAIAGEMVLAGSTAGGIAIFGDVSG
jgi:photosystem II stability/assembly factor-like uncharacterized protein